MAFRYNFRANQKKSKYGANKTEIDGIKFDSKKEAWRWTVLRDWESQGKITDLQRQVKYVLIPAQREPDTYGPKGGLKKGKLLEHECSYIADFTYKLAGTDELIVEDTKGIRTTDYIIKRKLMLFIHKIRIQEI